MYNTKYIKIKNFFNKNRPNTFQFCNFVIGGEKKKKKISMKIQHKTI